MTNKEKALALICTFATGDTAKAKELLAPGYIQHKQLHYQCNKMDLSGLIHAV